MNNETFITSSSPEVLKLAQEREAAERLWRELHPIQTEIVLTGAQAREMRERQEKVKNGEV